MYIHDKTDLVGLIPADVRAATYTTADFDISAYIRQGKLILDAEAQGSGITNTVKVQHSPAAAVGAASSAAGDADLPLNKSTGGKTKLAVKFTQTGARQIKHIDVVLKKNGTIASDKTLTLSLQSDSSGPDGTDLGVAGTVLANSIGASYETVRFTFATPVPVADSTVYWVVITSNYTASDTNYIDWHVTTVVSGGTVSTYAPSSWTAVTTQSAMFTSYQYNFADVPGGAFTAVGNAASLQDLGIDLDSLGPALRAVATVAGGSSTGAYSLVLVAQVNQS